MTEKKTQTSSQQPETKPVVDLVTSILNEVQKQVQSKTPKPLEGKAVEAVELFREIGAALELQRRPKIIRFEVAPPTVFAVGQQVKLAWESSTDATVSIDQRVGGVTTRLGEGLNPNSFLEKIPISATTIFTATAIAKGVCSSETKTVTVVLESPG